MVHRQLCGAGILFVACLCIAFESGAAIIASSGFNDAAGLNSNSTPNSPFTIGQTVDGRGAGEPGWADNWLVQQGGALGGGEHALILGAAALEGDGGLQLEPNPIFGQTRAIRRLATPQNRRFVIEQDVNFIGVNSLYSRPSSSAVGNEGVSIGPEWRISGPIGNRHFDVLDGIGDQLESNWESTGIDAKPGEWQHVLLDINVATQTWTFSVDGVMYNAPDPLGFRGTPPNIDNIEYITDSSGYIDSVVVRDAPEPASLALAPLGIALFALRRRR
jgi:hypothetical protein